MYSLVGKEIIDTQANELFEAVAPQQAMAKDPYLHFLEYVLPHAPRPASRKDLFTFDVATIRSYISHFLAKDLLTDLGTEALDTSPDSMKAGLEEIKKALSLMKELDPELHALFTKYIHTLFYHRSVDSGGGSVSTLVGVIWCCNRKNWSTWDTLEFLVHEMTHNLVFLDEYYHTHYEDLSQVELEENYALSAVLKTKRPLDKVFHSLVVGYEILNLRARFDEPADPKVHPPSAVLKKQCLMTCESLQGLFAQSPGLATDRVVTLTRKMEGALCEKSFS